MDGQHLIYFTDPMCSWCWGFSPVIEAVRARFGERLPIRLILGGLRPGTTEPMTAAAKADVKSHWTHVAEASGQGFDDAFFEREGFVYDTDPAARATVLVRREDPDLALDFLRATHEAFYAHNLDVTSPGVLADLSAPFGLGMWAFLAGMEAEDVKQETWRDYAISQRAGVTGFPTLIAGREGEAYHLIARGYQGEAAVTAAIADWLAHQAAA
ncbi:MAG TPA: DsbA family protein [Caulobacteraceae bacterium]